jgi:hypothetical protein
MAHEIDYRVIGVPTQAVLVKLDPSEDGDG